MSENPYQPPLSLRPCAAAAPRDEADMSLRKATMYVAFMTVGAAVLGSLVGFAIGTLAPDYYRQVFSIGPDAEFQSAAMGGVLGLLQGGALGLGTGILLVMIHYWYSFRVLRLRLKLE